MTTLRRQRVVARDEPLGQVEPRQLAALDPSAAAECGTAGFTTSPLSSIQLPRGKILTEEGVLIAMETRQRGCLPRKRPMRLRPP